MPVTRREGVTHAIWSVLADRPDEPMEAGSVMRLLPAKATRRGSPFTICHILAWLNMMARHGQTVRVPGRPVRWLAGVEPGTARKRRAPVWVRVRLVTLRLALDGEEREREELLKLVGGTAARADESS